MFWAPSAAMRVTLLPPSLLPCSAKPNFFNPGFSKKPESLVAAVNQEYQDLNFVLRDNDEVAFIPPVSGGMINDQNFKYSCISHV